MICVHNNTAEVNFSRFDLDSYQLFLKAKKLPESEIYYDWKADNYQLTTPARYAGMLGIEGIVDSFAKNKLGGHLFDYQSFIVRRALEAKRYAIYADCGLGKTAMFLEWIRQIQMQSVGKMLILSPLQIIEQTREEALLGLEPLRGKPEWTPWPFAQQILFLKTREELEAWLADDRQGAAIVNYEKLVAGQIPQLRHLKALVLDESSILKSGGGVIKWNLIKSAKGIEYKLSCTATPAPNDIMEYASQAAFLEKLRTEGEILWTFFSRDKRGNWRIKPHAQAGFYRFLSSWSIYLRNPKSFGWADNLSGVPGPEFFEHEIFMTPDQRKEANKLFVQSGAGLFGDKRMGIRERTKLSQLAKGFIYKADGLPATGKKAIRIHSVKPQWVARQISEEVEACRQTLVWTVFDEESRILSQAIPEIEHEVLEGSMKPEKRLEVIERFRTGKLPCLISKASLLGFGLNFQNCEAMIFSGWDDSYERFYQAIKRAHRYGQTKRLRVHLPFIAELEGVILENVLRKKENFERDAVQQEKFYREALAR